MDSPGWLARWSSAGLLGQLRGMAKDQAKPPDEPGRMNKQMVRCTATSYKLCQRLGRGSQVVGLHKRVLQAGAYAPQPSDLHTWSCCRHARLRR